MSSRESCGPVRAVFVNMICYRMVCDIHRDKWHQDETMFNILSIELMRPLPAVFRNPMTAYMVTIGKPGLRKLERLAGTSLGNTTRRSRQALGLRSVEAFCDFGAESGDLVTGGRVVGVCGDKCTTRVCQELGLA